MAESFGQYLSRKREAFGLTQTELAGRVGVTPTYISYLERGVDPTGIGQSIRPMIEVVDAIADALETPLAEVRCAAGYDPPEGVEAACEEIAVESSFDKSDFAMLHQKYEQLTPDQRRRISPVIEMLRHELDRIRDD